LSRGKKPAYREFQKTVMENPKLLYLNPTNEGSVAIYENLFDNGGPDQ
jgi:hypothetical protein